MESGERVSHAPPIDEIEIAFAFHVNSVRADDDRILYFGTPMLPPEDVVPTIWPTFREAGYEVEIAPLQGRPTGVSHVLIAEPISLGSDGMPWLNLLLFVATLASTLYVGAWWYHVDPTVDPYAILQGWPFAVAVMAVLGIHELGHYAMSRYHGVRASLPYFLPVPTIFGTMGAVIKISGRIPSRRALFDIGVAGPIAGLIAAVIVTIVGLHMPPITAPDWIIESETAVELSIGYPPLLEFLAWAFDRPLRFDDPATAPNPVVIAGWLGMFITFLNLIPVGQLDGGHITRAMLGPVQRWIGLVVPLVLLGLTVVLYVGRDVTLHGVLVWVIWAGFATILAAVGPAEPIQDSQLDRGRHLVGALTLLFGLLCFVPVPIEIVA